jgi:type IV secretory system conjugative DNA transfer VirD4/TraG family protein
MAATNLTIPPNKPVLKLSDSDSWTVQDSLEGTQIIGANGSGKTSGSGTALATRFLSLGYGGLILTTKNDEYDLWANPKTGYCARTGRLSDLIVLSKNGEHQFDFLEYELQRSGPGAGETLEIARLFSTVLEAAGHGSGTSDPYWSRALGQLLNNSIDMARFATHRVSLRVLSTVVHEAPLSIDETKGEDWQAFVRAAQASVKTAGEKSDLDLTLDYFNREFPRLNDKTRSSIVSMFTSMADVLLRGTIGSLFSGGKFTITPEQTQDGKLILIDLPVKEYGDTGRFAQMVFKYVWQKAAERRDKSKPMRPMFLWCDESQELITGYDAVFQSTARSSGVATVYLTQNISNYHARLGGGSKAVAETDSLLGSLSTKIFHANGDPTTNQWAERLFGYALVRRQGGSVSGGNTTINWSESNEPVIPARKFTMLKKGSAANKNKVEAIINMTGRKWVATDDNHITTIFEQSE